MAVAIFAAATLGVCASGRCRGLGAGRRRALTIHEPRAPIGREGGGATQEPPLCFRPAAVARRRCGACPGGVRVSGELRASSLCAMWPSRVPSPVGDPACTFARVLAPSQPCDTRRPARVVQIWGLARPRGDSSCLWFLLTHWAPRKETPSQASVNIDALGGCLVPRGRAHAGPWLP